MKIAISGKGGVGKTTLSAFLARYYSNNGYAVLAVDADPDANLAEALAMPDADKAVPLSEMKKLIEERTGSKPGTMGGFFKLNPRVDDLPDTIALKDGNLRLITMGTVKKGGAGCVCPESVMLKALIAHLVIARNEFIIMDMEAGIEHLGRGTSQFMDMFLIVVEPGKRSLETAKRIRRLANDLGIKDIRLVGNKIRNKEDIDFLKENAPDFNFAGFIPYDQAVINADLAGKDLYDITSEAFGALEKIAKNLIGD